MENKDRIKALNILFSATVISLIISIIIAFIFPIIAENLSPRADIPAIIAILSPVTTYIVGRILCFKEYKDETP